MNNAKLLSQEEIETLRELVEDRTGILLSAKKNFEIQSKLAPILETISDFERTNFIQDASKHDMKLQEIVNRITIGESYFFRNHPHFKALEYDIIPNLIEKNHEKRELNIWSAGCSTGEEPYSIAILLQRRFPQLANWNINITGTDINTSSLAKARSGSYTSWSFRGVDKDILSNYFTKKDRNRFEIDRDIINSVTFKRFNLMQFPFSGRELSTPFDLILCRNVLIYFANEMANQIVDAFYDVVVDNGYLLLGHSESFPAMEKLESIYAHATYFFSKSVPSDDDEISSGPERRLSYMPGMSIYDSSPAPELLPRTPQIVSPFPTPTKRAAFRPKSIAPKPPKAHDALSEELNQVREYSVMGQLKDARDLIQKLLDGRSGLDYRVHFLNAVISDQDDNTLNALGSLKQCIFLNKDFIVGHYYQGVISEREQDLITAKRSFRNVVNLAVKSPKNHLLEEGGGITAGRLLEIATERLKELELQKV